MRAVSEPLRSIGQQLKQLRRNAGLTQVQLAERMDISQSLVSVCENGTASITLAGLLKWVDICGGTIQVTSPKMKTHS